MKHRNFPMVSKVVFGKGSFKQLYEIIEPQRKNDCPFVFLVDDFFESNNSLSIGLEKNDKIIHVNSWIEPKTEQVDKIKDDLLDEFKGISGVIGIGGGTILDLAKAVSLMLTNNGSSSEYQGWDLIKNKAIYHVGIPTISGTGAEVSRTCILTGPKMKLGINSDYTPFDQVILDPNLAAGVPKNQWFYSGMDCYIHCIESLTGTYLNAFSQSYGEKALELCRDVYFKKCSEEESRDKLMMASWHGGMSIAYSQVGVAHAVSYGLSFLLGVRHGVGNCMVFDNLEEYYPEGVKEFKKMVEINEVEIPKNVCSNLSDEEFDKMIDVALNLVPLWENALGKNWKQIMTRDVLRKLYEKI